MGVIDKWHFEARGGHGCDNSDYRLLRTTCCGFYVVEDVELLDLYVDPADLNNSIALGYSPRHGEPLPMCPFCGAAEWDLVEIQDITGVPEVWEWAAKRG